MVADSFLFSSGRGWERVQLWVWEWEWARALGRAPWGVGCMWEGENAIAYWSSKWKGSSGSPLRSPAPNIPARQCCDDESRPWHNGNISWIWWSNSIGFSILGFIQQCLCLQLKWEGDVGGIVLNGTEYQLRQLHWHSPSEHSLNGRRYRYSSIFK